MPYLSGWWGGGRGTRDRGPAGAERSLGPSLEAGIAQRCAGGRRMCPGCAGLEGMRRGRAGGKGAGAQGGGGGRVVGSGIRGPPLRGSPGLGPARSRPARPRQLRSAFRARSPEA